MTAASRFRVALTIDTEHPDRPAARGNDERLLEVLAASGTRATCFIQGRWAEAYPELARRIATNGHLVGSHSHYHARVPLFSDAGLAEDIRDAEAAIRDATSVDPRPWFRCPFGAGSDDPRVLGLVEAAGYRHVGWHVAADDWDPARSAAQVEESIVTGVIAHGDGAVAILHSWPDQTTTALPAIIRRLAEAGATFVGIDELDSIPPRPAWAEEPSGDGVTAGSTGGA